MLRVFRGYIKTLRQYAAAPKTQYEYKHYGIFLVMTALIVFFIWGGMYLCYEMCSYRRNGRYL